MMIAQDVGGGFFEENGVEVAEGEEEPAEGDVGEAAEGFVGHPEFGVFEEGDQERGGGAGAPALGDDFEIAFELEEAIGGVAAEVRGVGVIGVAEGDDDVGEAAGGENAFDFTHDFFGEFGVFENGVAFDALELVVGEGECFGIGGDVDVGEGKEIEIDIAGGVGAGGADVEIPAAEGGSYLGFGGVVPDGGRREEPLEALAEVVLPDHAGGIRRSGFHLMKAYSGIYSWLRGIGMNRTMKFGMVITLVVGTLAWLAIGGTTESASYFKTIPEVEKMSQADKAKKLRVGGIVEPGTITRNGNTVNFVLKEGDWKMKITYASNEPLPDTFKDGSQALIDGRMGDGVFHATKIAAKCASKYEAKPGQNYKGTASYEKKS